MPGRASVGALGAELLADETGLVAGALDEGTRLKLVARPNWTTWDGVGVYEVAGLDDDSITGFVRATQLIPRDSAAPVAVSVDALPTIISPNDDDSFDTTDLSARFSETVDWTLRVTAGDGTVVRSTSGTGQEPLVSWTGLVDGTAVADGTYTYTFRGQDAWQNAPEPVAKSGKVKVDTTPPTLSEVPEASDQLPWFSPNGDGSRDTFALTGATSESGRINVRVRDATDTTVRSYSVAVSAGGFSIPWDGRNNNGAILPDGTYTVRLTPADNLGNVGASDSLTLNLITLLGSVGSSKKLFYPHDADGLASKTVLSFALARPGTVTWTIRDASGTEVVDTLLDGVELGAGATARSFYGRRVDGTMLPVGKYRSYVSVTDGQYTAVQTASFEMNAFSITSSTATPRRGRTLTVWALPAETLSSNVTLGVLQPGLSTWSVRMRKLSTGRYRAIITLKSGGSSGTLTLRVRAKDLNGRTNTSYLLLPIN